MNNLPEVTIGLVAVSKDCFFLELSKRRRDAVFAVKEMGRFYRHVLIGKQYPHHCAVLLNHAGKPLFSALKMLGIKDVCFNQSKGMLYKNENPF